MLLKLPRCTWSMLKHTLYSIKQCRSLTSLSLYDKNGKWEAQLSRDTMLQIESIWKERLVEIDAERANSHKGSKEKFYVLSMFPYPSGKLHMGHVRVYTISDVMARYHRMLNHQVIHPMGWDAFGLPAENAAIERNMHPKTWTYSNIEMMKEQLKDLCFAFDWDREVTTCDPAYYRWTQWIFLKMFEAGLVYQRQASVNWDPVDETVLANEQIDSEGRSWRSGALSEKKYLTQWYIQTTAYSKSLVDGLDQVQSDLWKHVISLQRHWIGECTGCRFNFQLKVAGESETLDIYTENPEALYGVSHIALSPEHRFNQTQYYKQASSETSEVLLSVEAVNPLTGEILPVVISEKTQFYPSNDTHLGIPAVSEIDRTIADLHSLPWKQVYSTEKDTMINSDMVNGLTLKEAAECIMSHAKREGFGGHLTSSHLQDWLISRQRYWGTPIPIIHCPKCKAVPVPLDDLPVQLPDMPDSSIGQRKTAVLENEEWLNVTCPKCGGEAKRETDTMDTFLDSSWYFLRYLDPNNSELPLSKQAAMSGMPVDLYIGGVEHAYLHLYYARFFNHFLCDLGLTPHREPFINLLTQGMVKGESYKVAKTGVYLRPSDVEKIDGKYVEKGTGNKVLVAYEKMSKSKHNGVDPQELLATYGADMTRLCILSNVAPKSERNWNNEVYIGVQKWLARVWKLVGILVQQPSSSHTTPPPQTLQHWDKTIRSFRNSYLMEINYHMNKSFLFNTAISRFHEITNDLKKVPEDVAVVSVEYRRQMLDLIKMIAPFAPLYAMECWTVLHKAGIVTQTSDVLSETWPQVDDDAMHLINVVCNATYIGSFRIDVSSFKDLSSDTAFTLAQQQTFYKDIIKDNTVANINLNILDGWMASLYLNVPDVTIATKEKKKDKSKKGKKANKTKVME